MIKVPQIKARGVLLMWGRFRFMWGHAVFYVGAIQLIMLALVTYNTTLRDWAWLYLGMQLQLWHFIAGLFISIAIGFALEYVLSIPALIAVSNEQMYAHQSPIKTDFEDVKKKLDAVEKELRELKDVLKDSMNGGSPTG